MVCDLLTLWALVNFLDEYDRLGYMRFVRKIRAPLPDMEDYLFGYLNFGPESVESVKAYERYQFTLRVTRRLFDAITKSWVIMTRPVWEDASHFAFSTNLALVPSEESVCKRFSKPWKCLERVMQHEVVEEEKS